MVFKKIDFMMNYEQSQNDMQVERNSYEKTVLGS